jgi:hypothetical protein
MWGLAGNNYERAGVSKVSDCERRECEVDTCPWFCFVPSGHEWFLCPDIRDNTFSLFMMLVWSPSYHSSGVFDLETGNSDW